MKAMVLAFCLTAVLAAVVRIEPRTVPKRGASAVTNKSGGAGQRPGDKRRYPRPGSGDVGCGADAAYYCIGWVNMETFRAVQAEGGRQWLDVFAFHAVVNREQTAQTLSDLEPGVKYAFIAASVERRFGNVAGLGWIGLTWLQDSHRGIDMQ